MNHLIHNCHCTGQMFYSWLASWNWDHSSLPKSPRDVCLERFTSSRNETGPDNLRIDACACDAIVTDCHVNAVSLGEGVPENSAPFNVFNSAGLHRPHQDPNQRKEWWNAASKEFAWRHECAALHLLRNVQGSAAVLIGGGKSGSKACILCL